MTPVEVSEGDGPVILGAPLAGTFLPEALLARLNARGRALAASAWIACVAAGCIKIEQTGQAHPNTFEGIDAMCRRQAEDYRERARSYARCMNEHGYPNRGADDY